MRAAPLLSGGFRATPNAQLAHPQPAGRQVRRPFLGPEEPLQHAPGSTTAPPGSHNGHAPSGHCSVRPSAYSRVHSLSTRARLVASERGRKEAGAAAPTAGRGLSRLSVFAIIFCPGWSAADVEARRRRSGDCVKGGRLSQRSNGDRGASAVRHFSPVPQIAGPRWESASPLLNQTCCRVNGARRLARRLARTGREAHG